MSAAEPSRPPLPSPLSARTPARRNAGIDLLRGLSILLVVAHHIGLRVPLKATAVARVLPRRVVSAVVGNGYESVFVFFVVSGFLITTGTLARWGPLRRVDLRAFYVRRASRILPCLLALLAVLAALHAAGAEDYTIHGTGQTLPRALLAALGLHLNWFEGETGYLPGGWDVLWSLSIEEAFYLGFPLACLALGERWLVPPLVLLALSLPWTRGALAANAIWQEKAYLPGMAGIATGVLAGLLARKLPAGRALAYGVIVAGGLGLAAVLFFEDLLWGALGEGTMLVLTISSALLVVGFHVGPGVGVATKLPGSGPLQSFGRLSYEVYLTHMFVVFALVRLFRASGAAASDGYVVYLAGVPLTWALGLAVARGWSIPCEGSLRDRLKG